MVLQEYCAIYFLLNGFSLQANPSFNEPILEAIQIAQADSTRSRLYGQLSSLYGEQLDKRQQLAFSDSCMKYAQLDQAPLLLLKAYGLKGRALAANDQLDASVQLLEQAMLIINNQPQLVTTTAYVRLQIEYCRLSRNNQSAPLRKLLLV